VVVLDPRGGLRLLTPQQAILRAQELVASCVRNCLVSCWRSAGRRASVPSAVLDASALLVLLDREPGAKQVAEALPGAVISGSVFVLRPDVAFAGRS